MLSVSKRDVKTILKSGESLFESSDKKEDEEKGALMVLEVFLILLLSIFSYALLSYRSEKIDLKRRQTRKRLKELFLEAKKLRKELLGLSSLWLETSKKYQVEKSLNEDLKKQIKKLQEQNLSYQLWAQKIIKKLEEEKLLREAGDVEVHSAAFYKQLVHEDHLKNEGIEHGDVQEKAI